MLEPLDRSPLCWASVCWETLRSFFDALAWETVCFFRVCLALRCALKVKSPLVKHPLTSPQHSYCYSARSVFKRTWMKKARRSTERQAHAVRLLPSPNGCSVRTAGLPLRVWCTWGRGSGCAIRRMYPMHRGFFHVRWSKNSYLLGFCWRFYKPFLHPIRHI